jgi:hypothetical protein
MARRTTGRCAGARRRVADVPTYRRGLHAVGSYLCADLSCSRNVRIGKATASFRPDPGHTVEERIAGLRSRLDAFLDAALSS